MNKPPHDTRRPPATRCWEMACDTDDREGESPSPMEPRLGRMFHSSATGRRRRQTLPEAPGLRQERHPRDDTAGSAGSEARISPRPRSIKNVRAVERGNRSTVRRTRLTIAAGAPDATSLHLGLVSLTDR